MGSMTLKQLCSQSTRVVDLWLLDKLKETVITMNKANSVYEFAHSTGAFYDFFQKCFCDVYLEVSKPTFPYKDSNVKVDPKQQEFIRNMFHIVLEISYRLLHPIMPFLTEELWQHLPKELKQSKACIVATYPTEAEFSNFTCASGMDITLAITTAIRSTKESLNIPTKKPNVFVVSSNKIPCELLGYAATLSNSTSVTMTDANNNKLPQCAKCVLNAA